MPATADESAVRKQRSAARLGQARARLHEVISDLRQTRSVIPVAVAALRHQNADIDEDVAAVLQGFVGACIGEQIERLEAVLPLLGRPSRTSS